MLNVAMSLAALFLGFFPMVYIDSIKTFGGVIDGVFWLIIPLVLLPPHQNVPGKAPLLVGFNRLFLFFFYGSLAFLVLEVLLFLGFGRLPALSFSDSFLVRFGGLWDDPNGFSVFVAFFLPMAFFGMRTAFGTVAAVVSVAALLLATQSGTGILATALAFVLTCVTCFLFDRASKSYLYAIAVPFALVIGALFVLLAIADLREALFDMIELVLELKRGSIDAHSDSIGTAASLTLTTALGLTPLRAFGESAYVNFLTNYGIFYILVFLFMSTVFLMSCMRAMRRSQDARERTMLACILCFELAYLLSLVNLPLDRVFPVNLLFILLGIVPLLITPFATAATIRRGEMS